ncbi:hypothetical protein K493DRAFT_387193 [Basidiobolus meristosporus CBS 931.73]|uniref:Uncharacterized protein n=1 Tax=Basidiobolus meristosporus CBS 931.73 TaxID=1314790 RepID=A0A1Y1XGN6_9FUNG|nr:hypothetical protein K493DRAFT_387193 [Basidiobolus meristosporus CBS 931.73]|eukprot:ORX84911.1 hypothetical protein K493DRAFT_387193 [Basidiobolus meristosporus CBS 931.73]
MWLSQRPVNPIALSLAVCLITAISAFGKASPNSPSVMARSGLGSMQLPTSCTAHTQDSSCRSQLMTPTATRRSDGNHDPKGRAYYEGYGRQSKPPSSPTPPISPSVSYHSQIKSTPRNTSSPSQAVTTDAQRRTNSHIPSTTLVSNNGTITNGATSTSTKPAQPTIANDKPIPFNCSETTANIKLRPIAAIDIRIKKRIWWETPTEFLDKVDDFDVVLYDRRKRFLKVIGTVSAELAVHGLLGLDIYFALRLHLLPHLGRYVVVYGRCGVNCTYCGFRRIKFINIEIKKRSITSSPMRPPLPEHLTLAPISLPFPAPSHIRL